MRGIWTIDIPADIVDKYLCLMNLNYDIPLDDAHNAVGGVLEYLKRLPTSLLPGDLMKSMSDKITWQELRKIILEQPAPIRQMVKVLALHMRKVLDAKTQNGVTLYSLVFLGPLLIRSDALTPIQAKSIQDGVVQAFVTHAAEIVEDIHMFIEAPQQPVLHRARLIEAQTNAMPDVLEGARGLLVSVVRVDSMDWCTAFTANRRVGLVHKSNLKMLSPQEESEMNSGVNIDSMMDVVRERMPDMMLLFDSMLDESMKLTEALQSV